MKEYCEFRIIERHAHLLFADDEGERLDDSIRKIAISCNDPKYPQIGILDARLNREGRGSFFLGWHISRRYSRKELDAATLFQLIPSSTFEPCGEECGTEYDENSACVICGAGARQVSPLRLRRSSLSPRKDIAISIAGELVVSDRFVDLFRGHKMQGVDFQLVQFPRSKNAHYPAWYQPVFSHTNAELSDRTTVGIHPFNLSPASNGVKDIGDLERLLPSRFAPEFRKFFAKQEIYRCPLGDTIGLNLISEVVVTPVGVPSADFFSSRQRIGVRRGLLRPQPVWLVTPRLWRAFQHSGLKGARFEVARIE